MSEEKSIKPIKAPKVFITKTWGFSPNEYPLVGFSTKGGQNKFLKEASRDDWLVIVGTKGEPTPPEQQGQILGICQLGKDKVDPVAILNEIGTEIKAHEYDKNGKYRWAWALPMLKAKALNPPVDCKEVIGSYLSGQHWATYAPNVNEKLGIDIAKKLLSLDYVDSEVHEIPILAKANIFANTLKLDKKYSKSGPPPSSSRSGSKRELGEGFTYALKLIGRENNAIKIGMCHDLQKRVKSANKDIRPSVTGCEWKLILTQPFLTEKMAYNFEQILLQHFSYQKFEGEREIIKVKEQNLTSIWTMLFSQKKWIE